MSSSGGFSWTVVVLTCQHKDSVYSFQRELEMRQQHGSLSPGALVLTVQDRQEPLGSGGATLNALLVAAEHLSNRAGHTVVTADVLDDAHILILHTVSPAAACCTSLWCFHTSVFLLSYACRLRAATSPGARVAGRFVGFRWKKRTSKSRPRSAAWTCCWTASAVRFARALLLASGSAALT